MPDLAEMRKKFISLENIVKGNGNWLDSPGSLGQKIEHFAMLNSEYSDILNLESKIGLNSMGSKPKEMDWTVLAAISLDEFARIRQLNSQVCHKYIELMDSVSSLWSQARKRYVEWEPKYGDKEYSEALHGLREIACLHGNLVNSKPLKVGSQTQNSEISEYSEFLTKFSPGSLIQLKEDYVKELSNLPQIQSHRLQLMRRDLNERLKTLESVSNRYRSLKDKLTARRSIYDLDLDIDEANRLGKIINVALQEIGQINQVKRTARSIAKEYSELAKHYETEGNVETLSDLETELSSLKKSEVHQNPPILPKISESSSLLAALELNLMEQSYLKMEEAYKTRIKTYKDAFQSHVRQAESHSREILENKDIAAIAVQVSHLEKIMELSRLPQLQGISIESTLSLQNQLASIAKALSEDNESEKKVAEEVSKRIIAENEVIQLRQRIEGQYLNGPAQVEGSKEDSESEINPEGQMNIAEGSLPKSSIYGSALPNRSFNIITYLNSLRSAPLAYQKIIEAIKGIGVSKQWPERLEALKVELDLTPASLSQANIDYLEHLRYALSQDITRGNLSYFTRTNRGYMEVAMQCLQRIDCLLPEESLGKACEENIFDFPKPDFCNLYGKAPLE